MKLGLAGHNYISRKFLCGDRLGNSFKSYEFANNLTKQNEPFFRTKLHTMNFLNEYLEDITFDDKNNSSNKTIR